MAIVIVESRDRKNSTERKVGVYVYTVNQRDFERVSGDVRRMEKGYDCT